MMVGPVGIVPQSATRQSRLDDPFKDYPTTWAALGGDLGNRIKTKIRDAGLEPMGKVFDIGFRQIATQRRIDKVEDLAGIKMQVSQSPLYVGLFRRAWRAARDDECR